jgi:hypothetical protein
VPAGLIVANVRKREMPALNDDLRCGTNSLQQGSDARCGKSRRAGEFFPRDRCGFRLDLAAKSP